jgi:hypothetical protein
MMPLENSAQCAPALAESSSAGLSFAPAACSFGQVDLKYSFSVKKGQVRVLSLFCAFGQMLLPCDTASLILEVDETNVFAIAQPRIAIEAITGRNMPLWRSSNPRPRPSAFILSARKCRKARRNLVGTRMQAESGVSFRKQRIGAISTRYAKRGVPHVNVTSNRRLSRIASAASAEAIAP